MSPFVPFTMKTHWTLQRMVALTLALMNLNAMTISAYTAATCERPADVVFVLDTSNSIWAPDFDLQLNFVRTVVNRFTVHPDNMRIGLVTFGDYPQLQFHLNRYKHKRAVQRAISAVRQDGGLFTFTADALKYMHSRCFTPYTGMRDNVTHIAIVITDGRSYDIIETAYEAERARRRGIHMFAVGVGNKLDQAELNLIASNPKEEYSFLVDNFDGLRKIRDILAIKACTVTEPPTTTTTTTTTITTPTTTTTTTTAPPMPTRRTVVFEPSTVAPHPATLPPDAGHGMGEVQGAGIELVLPGPRMPGNQTQEPTIQQGAPPTEDERSSESDNTVQKHGGGNLTPGVGSHTGGHGNIISQMSGSHGDGQHESDNKTSEGRSGSDVGSVTGVDDHLNTTGNATGVEKLGSNSMHGAKNNSGIRDTDNMSGPGGNHTGSHMDSGSELNKKHRNKTKGDGRNRNDVNKERGEKRHRKKGEKREKGNKKGSKWGTGENTTPEKRRHHHGEKFLSRLNSYDRSNAAHSPHHVTAGCRMSAPTDIVFIIDSKIGGDSYMRHLWKFVHDVITRIRMDPDQLRVQFVHECASVPEIHLQEFTNKTALLDKLDGVVELPRRTAQMFEVMSAKMEAMGSPPDSSVARRRRVAVYVTDGHADDVRETLASAQRARDEHQVEVFAVGVGGRINPTELRSVVSCEADDHLFMLSHHAKLKRVSRHMAKKLCTEKRATPK